MWSHISLPANGHELEVAGIPKPQTIIVNVTYLGDASASATSLHHGTIVTVSDLDHVTSPCHHRHCLRFGSRHFTMPPSSLSPIWITSHHHATIITVSDLDHVTSPCHHHLCLRFGSRHFTMPPSSLSPIWVLYSCSRVLRIQNYQRSPLLSGE